MAGQYFPLCLVVLIFWVTNNVDCAPPAELSLDVALKSPYHDTYELYIGGLTKMEMKILFPSGTTAGTKVELLPSTNKTIMTLGEITVTKGSKIASISGSEDVVRHVTDDTVNSKVRHSTWAVIELGDVLVTDNGGTDADYTYTFEYEAYVVSTDGLADNESHPISGGVEFDNSAKIWVGQIMMYIRTGVQSNGKTPAFQMENVTEIKRMSNYPVTFEAWVPYPNSFIAVEAIALSTTNDDMRVVSIKHTSSGTNYEFATPTLLNKPLLIENGVDCDADPTGAGSRRLRLELGNVPNKGSRDAAATGDMDKLAFEAVVHMKGTSILNDEYPFGVGVEIDGLEVWVATVNLTAVLEDLDNVTLDAFVASDGLTTKKVGEAFMAKASMGYPRGRGPVTAVYKVETKKNSTGAPGVLISQASVESMGLNVECGTVTITLDSSEEGGINDIAYISITAANHGLNSSNTVDDQIHINIVMVGVIGSAVDGAKYDVVITSNVTSAQTQTVQYTMSGTLPYDSNTNHTFELANDCGDDLVIPEGTTFDMTLTVVTQRGANPESLQIEFPIPANVTDGMFVVCGIEVVKIGSNLGCFSSSMIMSSANYTTLADGTHEYVAMNLKPACNLGLSDDEEDDKLVLRIKSRFKAGVIIINGEEYWYGIGSKYTSTQIWVAQYPGKGIAIFVFGGPAIITGINVVINNYTLPGNYVVTRSFDGSTFTSVNIDTTAPTNNGSHHIYALQKPVMGTHAGLITEDCNSACGVEYDFTYVALKEYVDVFGDDSGTTLAKMVYAFDLNSTTCLDLPVQGETPPVLWAKIKTSLFNINPQSFTINVTGDNIECNPYGQEKVLQVSYPSASSSVGRFTGNVNYCTKATNCETQNMCCYTCNCPDANACSEVIIFFANGDSGGSWTLCDLSAANT